MPPSSEQFRLELLQAIQELTEAVKDSSKERSDSDKKDSESKKKDRETARRSLSFRRKLEKTQSLNTLRLGSTIKGMFDLRTMLGNVKSSNQDLVKGLAQAGALSRQNYSNTLQVFKDNNISMTQGIASFGEVVSMGMTRFGKAVLLMTGQLKVLGIQSKGLLQNIRFNTEVLGFSAESSREFAEQMVSSAMRFGTSVEGLVQAVNSMKKATINIAAELGPTTAKSVQMAAAMLGQGNNEMQSMMATFMTSILSGPEGFLKAGRLGVTAGVDMTPTEVAQLTMQALKRVGEIAPGPAVGAQHAIAGLEQANLLNREDIVLSRMMGKNIKQLTESQLKDSVARVGQMSFEQAWQNALYSLQMFALKALVGIAEAVSKYKTWIVPIALIATTIGIVSSTLIGMGTVLTKIQGVLTLMSAVGAGGAAAGAGVVGSGAAVAGVVSAGAIARFVGMSMLRLTIVGAIAALAISAGAYVYSKSKKGKGSGVEGAMGTSSGPLIYADDEFIRGFEDQRKEASAQRQEQIELAEQQLALMPGALANNPSESPVHKLTEQLSLHMLGINSLVELAEERTGIARNSSWRATSQPIGILKPGG